MTKVELKQLELEIVNEELREQIDELKMDIFYHEEKNDELVNEINDLQQKLHLFKTVIHELLEDVL